MSEMIKKRLVPKLRFPVFRGSGEWFETQLGKNLVNKPDYGVNEAAVPFSESLPKYLRITDISNDRILSNNKTVSVNIVANKENYLEDGDIVLARTGASVGKSYKYRKVDGKLVFAGFLIRVRPDRKKLNSELLFHFLDTDQFWDWVRINSVRGGQPGINGNQYSELPLQLPPLLKEQQKIADFLSSIDDLIAFHSQKLTALKNYKKGLMQQLFPAVGETVPRLRFPEFRDAGEWEDSTIGEISKITSGGTPSRKEKEYWNGDIPWISTTLINFNTIYTPNEYITKLGLKESSAKIFPKNTILMAMYGQGITRGKVAIMGIDASINQACAAILLDKKLNSRFVFQNLANRYEEIRDISNAGGQKNLSAGLIEKISFVYPADPILGSLEQQKIANCLSSMDKILSAQTQKVQSLREHKKGLMQQLFPSSEKGNE